MTKDAKEALVAVAEHQFAEHGVDGASLRDIARLAGQRNNSAVQYHFGGREGLVLEVFRRRMDQITDARRTFIEEAEQRGRGSDLRTLLEAVVLPLVDHIRSIGPGSSYAQFMTRASGTAGFDASDFDDERFAESRAIQGELARRTIEQLSHLEAATAMTRLQLMLHMVVSALAAFEQNWSRGLADVTDLDRTVGHLLDMSLGALLAPESTTGAQEPG